MTVGIAFATITIYLQIMVTLELHKLDKFPSKTNIRKLPSINKKTKLLLSVLYNTCWCLRPFIARVFNKDFHSK